MFDLQNKKEKQRFQQQQERLYKRFERLYQRQLIVSFRRQFKLAAKIVEQGESDVFFAVESEITNIRRIITNNFKRVIDFFGKKVFDEFDKIKGVNQYLKKDRFDEFQAIMDRWIQSEAIRQENHLSKTTKKILTQIVKKGQSEDEAPVQIAKRIITTGKITEKFRAARIARTHTHSASVNAQQEAVKATRIKFQREWITAIDERTRINHLSANGEVVDMDEKFRKTGEPLRYPGDPSGSPGNIINCRCVVGYISPKSLIR